MYIIAKLLFKCIMYSSSRGSSSKPLGVFISVQSDYDYFISITTNIYLKKNSNENHITTTISILNRISIASASYSFIVENTLKARHVNTIRNLKKSKQKEKIKIILNF